MRVALMFLAALMLAQSQPPSPTPPEAAEAQKQEGIGKTDPTKNTDPATSSVTAIPKAKHGDHADDDPTDPPSNWWLIIPTIVIALSTVVQVRVYWRQKELMAAALTETRKAAAAAADSAEIAKQTLHITQRAHVGISKIVLIDPHPHMRSSDEDENIARSCAELYIKNSGATPAKNFSYSLQIRYQDLEGFYPPPKPLVYGPTTLLAYHEAPARRFPSLSENFSTLNKTQIRSSVDMKLLKIDGEMVYDDAFGIHHTVKCEARIADRMDINGTFSFDVRTSEEESSALPASRVHYNNQ